MKKVLNPDYKMTFGKAVNRFWSSYFDFSGRATRAEFFFALLFNAIVSSCFFFLAVGGSRLAAVFGLIWGVAVLIPAISLLVRRLHDTNKSRADLVWIVVCSVLLLLTSRACLSEEGSVAFVIAGRTCFVIFAVFAIYLLAAVLSDTVPGENKYGDSEKYLKVEEEDPEVEEEEVLPVEDTKKFVEKLSDKICDSELSKEEASKVLVDVEDKVGTEVADAIQADVLQHVDAKFAEVIENLKVTPEEAKEAEKVVDKSIEEVIDERNGKASDKQFSAYGISSFNKYFANFAWAQELAEQEEEEDKEEDKEEAKEEEEGQKHIATMSDKTIEQRVKEIIVEQLNVNEEQLTPEASFMGDLDADPLDKVELVMAFEEAFKDEINDVIPEADAEKLKTVGDVIKYIEEKKNAAK